MKIAVLVIASPGELYDAFKVIWLQNIPPPALARVYFLYGRGSVTTIPCPFDLALPDVEENIIPGALLKTLAAFKAIDQDYDYVVRTNLSSLYVWPYLFAFLASQRSERFVAGCSPDRSHVGGCGMIFSHDVVETICNNRHHIDTSLVDDVALSRFLFPRYPVVWTPRVDFVYTDAIETHNVDEGTNVFHFRFKNYDRTNDPQRMQYIFEKIKYLPTVY